jgi:ectoine hydroxylase-related dioxygenase (phytanoyl-CoA dioxygenase family)
MMDEIKKLYDSNGYFFPLDVIPEDMAKNAALRIKKISIHPPSKIIHPWNLQAHLLANWIYNICVYSKVLDAVEAVIGPNILIQSADIFVKLPKSTKHINWHQDANYWGLEPYELVTGWIALTDVFPENGCMDYLPKSHLNKKINHIETFDKNSDLTRGQEINLKIDKDKKIPVILKAGQMSLHHCLLAHGSGPNLTDNYRIGIAVRYLPTHVRQTEGPFISMILARGKDKYNHFVKDKIPKGDFDETTIAEHDKAMTPHAPSNYATS